MTVGDFQEIIGTDGFDSISGSDLTVVYGLQGDDVLNSIPTFAGGVLPNGGDTSILVGGMGDNAYQIRNNSTSIVIENNNSNDNILWTTIGSNNPGLSLNGSTSFVAEIDNRHLYLGDTTSDQYVILIDWQVDANQIESLDLVEGRISYDDVAASFRDSDGYRGNFAWDELTDEINLERLGLEPAFSDDVLETIVTRARELEGIDNNPDNGGIDNFQEIIGTNGSDSIQGSDLTIVYGLQGRDVLNSVPTFSGGVLPNGGDTSILVGGMGDNRYQIRNNSTSIVIENDNSNDNILWTTIGSNNPGLSLSGETSFVAEIDNRHLYLGDTTSDQYVILIDWQVEENQIESFDLVEGRISYEDVASSFRDSDGYRGNFAWDELTDEIDFGRLGLNPDSLDDIFGEIRERSVELENANNAPQTVELFRFRNSSYSTGTYIFVNETEKNNIENSESLSQSFVVEGVTETGAINPAFTASLEPGDDLLPFFRLSSLVNPGTFLFVSTEEYNAIFAENSGQRTEWEPQGFDNLGLDIPEFYLYGVGTHEGREFNRFQNIENGTFLYASEAETTAIINNPSFSSVFVNQGVAFKSLL